jgi:BASS family bile acid:Na+ symporter
MFERILSFYTRYFAIWVVAFGVAAYLFPGPFKALGQGMDWLFALTMFGIGAVLEAKDFKRIAERPSIVAVGTAAQYSIMPLTAYAIAKIFNLVVPHDIGIR